MPVLAWHHVHVLDRRHLLALYLLLFRGCSYGTYSIVHTTISQVVCLSTYIDIGPHYGKATVLAVLTALPDRKREDVAVQGPILWIDRIDLIQS